MQIPPLKKSTFYVAVALVLLAGIIIGGLFISYAFYKNKDNICLFSKPPKINTNLTSKQIEKATSPESNKIIFGKVISKGNKEFAVQTTITNPLNGKVATTTDIKIAFDESKDEIVLVKSSPTAGKEPAAAKLVAASYGDIKVGDIALVKIVAGKKTIYLTPAP